MSPLSYPALRHRRPGASLAYGPGGPFTTQRFVEDIAALSSRLPEGRHVVNLCSDRYRFSVGLIAALQRGQVTLLPANPAPVPLAALAGAYPQSYFLHDDSAVPAGMPALRFPEQLAAPSGARIPELPPEQVAVVLFTSGSTGTPAPHPRSWGAMIASTRAAARRLGLAELVGASLLGTVPQQHSYGLESIILLSLQHGFAFRNTRPLLPADIIAELAQMPPPRILVTTPIHLRSLVAHDGSLPPVHRILCATAPLAPELARRAEERFGAPLHEIYGCTEIGQIAVRRTVETLEWSCIEGVELHQHGGEVLASGPAAAATAALNDAIDLLEPGRFLLRGRKSDMVNIAGKRSSLSYLNFQLNAIEGVLDGVFVMPADDGHLTRLAAYVVAPGLSAAQIQSALRKVLDPAFLPRPLRLVDALPRNALGKLSAQAIAELSCSSGEP